MSDAPPKFIKEAGVKRLNPEWKKWRAEQKQHQSSSPGTGANEPTAEVQSVAPAMKNIDTALPVITSVLDQQQNLSDTQVDNQYQATMKQAEEKNIAATVGLSHESLVDKLNRVFAKYEVPLGLFNKLLMLSDFELMEMIVDDSYSMDSSSDARGANGKLLTRWGEVEDRLYKMLELISYIPTPDIHIYLLNRYDHEVIDRRQGEEPAAFYTRAAAIVERIFNRGTNGGTPAREAISASLRRHTDKAVIRYFFGDGCPNGGTSAIRAITDMLVSRSNPKRNPFTFMSCTNDDSCVGWMKEAEEVAPYCSEFDDFNDEAGEILHDQGKAFPYTYGMHLVGQLVAAFNPDDLDAMDESFPFTKVTLDTLQGYVTSRDEYKYYVDCFVEAQTKNLNTERLSAADKAYRQAILDLCSSNFEEFVQADCPAKQLPCILQAKFAQEFVGKAGKMVDTDFNRYTKDVDLTNLNQHLPLTMAQFVARFPAAVQSAITLERYQKNYFDVFVDNAKRNDRAYRTERTHLLAQATEPGRVEEFKTAATTADTPLVRGFFLWCLERDETTKREEIGDEEIGARYHVWQSHKQQWADKFEGCKCVIA